jgi:Flp pilus assembly protein TadB
VIVVMLLLGCGAGAGVWLLARAVAPRPQPLAVALGGLDRRLEGDAPTDHAGALGALARRVLAACGVHLTSRAQSLQLVERSVERHALDKLVGLLGGVFGALVLTVGLHLTGIVLPSAFMAMLVLGCGAAGFLLPDIALADEATKKRRAFRHALSAYLDLVNVILAGGGGIESALFAAADAGDGWAFAALRRTLDRARLTGRSPWQLFAELGHELDVPELAELAASVSLAGSHGARIRQSLAAKADTLRGHQVAETEAAAEAATERMTIPVAVLLFGFLVFIAYPAVVQITSVSGTSP